MAYLFSRALNEILTRHLCRSASSLSVINRTKSPLQRHQFEAKSSFYSIHTLTRSSTEFLLTNRLNNTPVRAFAVPRQNSYNTHISVFKLRTSVKSIIICPFQTSKPFPRPPTPPKTVFKYLPTINAQTTTQAQNMPTRDIKNIPALISHMNTRTRNVALWP